jgi:hypothetical protein
VVDQNQQPDSTVFIKIGAIFDDNNRYDELQSYLDIKGFRREHLITIGMDFGKKQYENQFGTQIDVQFWAINYGSASSSNISRFMQGCRILFLYNIAWDDVEFLNATFPHLKLVVTNQEINNEIEMNSEILVIDGGWERFLIATKKILNQIN